jgi:uncharacterized protein
LKISMRSISLLATICLLLSAAIVHAAPIPKLVGRVNDYAHVLTPEQISSLTKTLKDEEDTSSNQIVILTVESLNGDSIEGFSYQVARDWKLGQHGKDNGVLIIAAVKDHKLRIEVGKGLEGALTDAISSQIIRNEIAPKFRSGDYGGGLSDGIAAIEQAIRGEYVADTKTGGQVSGGLLTLVIVLIILAMYVRSRRSMGWGRGYWGSPWYGGSFGSSGGGGFFDGGGGGGGFSGGGGSFGGGGASGGW